MSANKFLKKLFQAYYSEKKSNIPIVDLLEHREFGFLYWDKLGMMRHIGFKNSENLKNYLINNGPKHVYSSGSIYIQPDHPDMDKKQYQGCDLIIDIDVDHFETPCKNDHDYWSCKECGKSGKGMVHKCPKCGKLKLKNLNWICDICLDIAKREIIKLIYDFLFPDFGISEKDLKIAFSGHRGYHLKIENKKMRELSSEERREIADYITGDNISFEILGLKNLSLNISLLKNNIGWSKKIVSKIEEILKNYSNDTIIQLFKSKQFGLNNETIKYILNNKQNFLQTLWNIDGFGLKSWEKFLNGIIKKVGIEIDEPVTIDIHRLIRYPGSLHGKTGFKVQELSLKELDTFNPLNENDKIRDPIVFYSDITQKIEILASKVATTKIKGQTFGPYAKGEVIEVPHHIAVFLLCKEVAKFV
jgi:DNA primase small subunit